jgi:hypothetical protein
MAERPKKLTMPSFYWCPKCNTRLYITEHYFGREIGEAFGLLEHVSIKCKHCKLQGTGRNESEAFENLKR